VPIAASAADCAAGGRLISNVSTIFVLRSFRPA
jgi:hypothetical protein